MKYTKRFIEETFPVKEVSEISAKEKNVRNGHISTLHIWWARRPLAASRSTSFAALIPFPEDEKTINYFWSVLNPLFNRGILPKAKHTTNVVDAIKTFIVELSRWENSNNKDLVAAARKMILHFNNDIPPITLDPFGGGGSIPLECLRLGCETHSNDLNPVAVLIQKCTLEYPSKYGKPGYVEREVEEIENGEYIKKKKKVAVENVLLEDVKYWANWVFEESNKELAKFYPTDPDKSQPLAYIWARTIPCQNPSCGAEIPLLRQFWLSKKTKKIALYPFVKNKKLEFKIVGDGYEKWPIDFDADEGTTSRAIGKCSVCGSSVPADQTRILFKQNKSTDRMICVVLDSAKKGKYYRIANTNDEIAFKNSKNELIKTNALLKEKLGFEPIPDEEIPLMSGVFNVPIYGLNKWGMIFNPRQLNSLLTFVKYINELSDKNIISNDPEYSKAIILYLALALDRLSTRNSNLCVWHTGSQQTEKIFGLQALPMQWSYPESVPLNIENVTGFLGNVNSITSVISHLSFINNGKIKILQNSATNLSLEDSSLDAVFTDPPYYNSVPYADLSDYFYVWLKRMVGNQFIELFTTPLTPKKEEITEMEGWDPIRYSFKDKTFFEKELKKAFKESARLMKPGSISIIVYAHKTTEGWETLINSLLDSGLIVTGAWPIDTELESRLRAKEAAALASSIYIVCRKMDRQPTAFYNDVKEETKNYLSKKLDRLWSEGIGGADFFIAAIGSSIEVYGKYQSVIDYEGNLIRADKLLTDVRLIVTDYAVKKILHNGFATGISDLTRFYVLCRWEFKAAKIPFDEANKLAHSCHIELADSWRIKSFIKKEKEFVQILGPQDRDIEDIEDSGELIDILHYAIKLWEKGNKAEMQRVLNESGYAKSDAFFRVAQAIAETLPNESKEKKLLEGFLNLRERISDGFKGKDDTQGDFFKK